mmetsp:Transcript_22673/g.34265  ORF Transcript_22673/g.34265 Transcript_22673/m.34265 type:complete len:412 (-) Transcript_22673:263-1498(-)|eukprot:CAMPEP_0178908572 /NCGR_PEP_ID=MMETSP0786-20121207/7996_1 /TAXON_ID=186022 /ORGANISM="Thalassionema frauenfeldii, Strain CCMP 1798" /LENGTH=411 /DNA_ID=CAMNT_0020580487 /DNA_START=76 /DNA_END=1311 /DNA_ORIENTATION=-
MRLSVAFLCLLSFLSNHQPSESFSTPTKSWQQRLDQALLDIDGGLSPKERFELIQEAIQDPNFRDDITSGVEAIRKDGFGKGHPTLIEKLWPKGTIGRRDIEGIQTLVKTLPERAEELREASLTEVASSTSSNFPTARKIVSNVLQKAWENRADRTVTIATNALRSEPQDVETLNSTLVAELQGINGTTAEIRQFDDYATVGVDLSSFEDFTLGNMGEGLAKLSSYVYGYNSDEKTGEMTAPFVMQSFKMWIPQPKLLDAEPSDTSVKLEPRPSETLALLEFPGICTNAEVKRRQATLKTLLEESESWNIVNENVIVLQYNAPGTLPWRRKNQVGYVVEKVVTEETETTTTETEDKDDESVTEVVSEMVDTTEEAVEEEEEEVSEEVSEEEGQSTEEEEAATEDEETEEEE